MSLTNKLTQEAQAGARQNVFQMRQMNDALPTKITPPRKLMPNRLKKMKLKANRIICFMVALLSFWAWAHGGTSQGTKNMSRPTDFDTVNKVLRYADNGDAVNPADRVKITQQYRNYPRGDVFIAAAKQAEYAQKSAAERAAIDKAAAEKAAKEQIERDRANKLREEESKKKFAAFHAASAASVEKQNADLAAKAAAEKAAAERARMQQKPKSQEAGLGTAGMVILVLAGLGLAYVMLKKN